MASVKEKLYEGKAKIIYDTGQPDSYLVEYKDEATAFNALKRGIIGDKGPVNCEVSAMLFRYLERKGIPTHFIARTGEREMSVRRLKMIPVEVVVRNVAAGSLAKRLGLEEGTSLRRPVLEFYLKNDELGDPMINKYHILALDLATAEQVREMGELAMRVNAELSALLEKAGLRLVDFKLEFGLDEAGRIVLGDEISPDTCRFWDARTGEKLDKDRFRRDMGGVEEAYQEVLRRIREAVGDVAS